MRCSSISGTFKEKVLHLFLRRCAPFGIYLLGRSIRFAWVNDRFPLDRAARGESCLFCFWHNRLLMMPYVYRRYRGKKNMCAMASLSKDGEYISDVLRGHGFEVVRGSSSHGGDTAIVEMSSMLRDGMDGAMATDGPRGPVYRVQPGVILLSQMTGVPIVPATCSFTRAKRLKSWDRFVIPFPFTRCMFVYGEPIYVSRDCGDAEREQARKRLEEALRSIGEQAAKLSGAGED